MSGFQAVRVAKAWDEGPRLKALLLEAPEELRRAHTVPGQYVKARVPGAEKDAFLALANAPGGAALELLIQTAAAGEPAKAADAVAAVGAGGTVEITAPAGKGFPVAGERGRDALLFAGGSGISAIRSLCEWIAGRRADYGRVCLLFGARTAGDLAYRPLFEGWRGARIEVEPVLSRPDPGTWTGRVGYVQAALAELHVDAGKTSVFLAGGKAFDAAVVAAVTALGIPADRIFRNF